MIPDTAPIPLARTRTMGDTEVGRLAYGCWRFPATPQSEISGKIDAALEIGANMIDTADIYGKGQGGFGEAERMLGAVLSERPGLRRQICLVTKGGITPPVPYNSTRDYLIGACEASLRRLRTDHVDLYLIHRPDILAGHAEVAAALDELVTSGKARAVGVSNYTLEQTRALQVFLDRPLVAIQPEISAWEITALFDGTLDHAQGANLLPMAWSPLAGGALATGEAPQAGGKRFADLIAVLDRIAQANGTSRDCVALAWLLAHPAGIVPIIGTQSPERIRVSANAFEVKMSRRDWYEVLVASRGEKMP